MDAHDESFRRAVAFAKELSNPLPADKHSRIQQVKPYVLGALGRQQSPSLTPSEEAPGPPAINLDDFRRTSLMFAVKQHELAKAGHVRRT